MGVHRFSDDAGEQCTIRVIIRAALACPYFSLSNKTVRIFLDDICMSESERRKKQRRKLQPADHLENLYHLDMLSSIELITSFTEFDLAVDSSLSFLARTLLGNVPKRIVKVKYISNGEDSLVSEASSTSSCSGSTCSSAWTSSVDSGVISSAREMSSPPPKQTAVYRTWANKRRQEARQVTRMIGKQYDLEPDYFSSA